MANEPTKDAPESLEVALKRADPNLENQGDIAADDAGATALAERVTEAAGIQGEQDEEA